MNQLHSEINNFLESNDFSNFRTIQHKENPTLLKRKLDSFELYKEYIKGDILDWGCGTGLTSYIVKTHLKDQFTEIYGCDIRDRTDEILSQQTGLIYSNLEHHYKMPYKDRSFDIIIAEGVLEHVANDYESLKEIYRILKDDGYFAITFLPNKLSYTEAISQSLSSFPSIQPHYHRRKYSLREIKYILLHNGLLPVFSGYHQVLPSLTSLQHGKKRIHSFLRPISKLLFQANPVLERMWPINKLSSNIFVISQKKKSL